MKCQNANSELFFVHVVPISRLPSQSPTSCRAVERAPSPLLSADNQCASSQRRTAHPRCAPCLQIATELNWTSSCQRSLAASVAECTALLHAGDSLLALGLSCDLRRLICLSPRSPRGLVTRLRVGLRVIRVSGSTTGVRQGQFSKGEKAAPPRLGGD